MTMQPFKIQSPTLSLNGVNIDTSAQGKLVIPGVTRAGTSVAIEVNDTADQTVTWTGTPVVIDGYTYYCTIQGNQPIVGWTAATYAIDGLDGDGYINSISVVTGGTGYTGEAVTYSQVMYAAPEGTSIDNTTTGLWIEIPFSVRCGAGEITSEFGGGGSGSGLVQRTVNFPTGEDGDTAGTMALDPGGNVYVCTANYVAPELLNIDVSNLDAYDIGQSGGALIMIVVDPTTVPDIVAKIGAWSHAGQFNWPTPADFTMEIDGVDGVRTCTDIGYLSPSGNLFVNVAYVSGDPTYYDAGVAAVINFTSATPVIWEQLVIGSNGYADAIVEPTFGNGLNINTYGDAVLFSTDGPGGGVDRGLRWDYGSQNGGVDSFIRQDDAGLTVQSYSDPGNPNGAPVIIRNGDTNQWQFKSDGTIMFPDGSSQTTAYTGQTGAASGYMLTFGDINSLVTQLAVVALDGSGNAYYCGSTTGLTPGNSPTIIKVDSNGVVLWQSTLEFEGVVTGAWYFQGLRVVAQESPNSNPPGPVWNIGLNTDTGDVVYNFELDTTSSGDVILMHDTILGEYGGSPSFSVSVGSITLGNTGPQCAYMFMESGGPVYSAYVTDGSSNLVYYGAVNNQLTADVWAVGRRGSTYQTLITRYDNNAGAIAWHKSIDFGRTDQQATSVAYDGNGYIYIASNNADNGNDMFVTKMEGTTGNVIWQRGMGFNLTSDPMGGSDGCITVDGNGDIIAAWQFGSIGSRNLDLLIVKFNANGDVLWQRSLGTANYDFTSINTSTEFLTADAGHFYIATTTNPGGPFQVGGAIQLPLDGSGTGGYGAWEYVAQNWSVLTIDVTGGSTDITGDLTTTTYSVGTVNGTTATTPGTLNVVSEFVFRAIDTGNVTFNGNTISTRTGYPTIANAYGSMGGVEIDYNGNSVNHNMYLNNGGLSININSNMPPVPGGWAPWQFGTDGALTFPDGTKQTTGAPSEMLGNGAQAQVGTKRTVLTDWNDYQGGEWDGATEEDWFKPDDVAGVSAGDIITFRGGEVRTIDHVDTVGGYTRLRWTGPIINDGAKPRFPLTITSADYVEAVKSTVRLKPDNAVASAYNQYVDIYAGGGVPEIDNRHIHMKGHDGNVELFLGTDSNYVSTKEAGITPAAVNLHSENDINVVDTNLRLNRKGSTWAAVYGDGENYNFRNNNWDVSYTTSDVDEHNNLYVGGEHDQYADALISKYGPDGNLIWSKYNNCESISGYKVDGIAYHNGEVASLVQSNYNRNYAYYKLTIHDSETGEVKATNDLYDPDGSINAYSMVHTDAHGWVVVGRTSGEAVVSPTITAVGGGIEIIDLLGSDCLLDTRYPQPWANWSIAGTGILGSQNLQNGTGVYKNTPITTVTGNGAGAVAEIYIDYNLAGSVNVYSLGIITNSGAGYTSGDSLKVPGSLLGGVDGGTTFVATAASVSPGDNSTTWFYFAKTDYPELYNQLKWATWIAEYNAGNYDVLGIESSGDNWKVTVNSTDSSATTITLHTNDGNDFLFDANANDQLYGYNSYQNGTPSKHKIRIDLSYMGYGGAEFRSNKTILSGTDFTAGDLKVTTKGADTYVQFINPNASVSDFLTVGTIINVNFNDATSTPQTLVATVSALLADFGDTNNPGKPGVKLTVNSGPAPADTESFDVTGLTYPGIYGTYTLTRLLNTIPWVWTQGWTRYLDSANTTDGGTAHCVAEGPSGELVVGGYTGSSYGNSFAWKLESDGTTSWIKTITNDSNTTCGVAVSPLDGSVYTTTDYSSINKFSSAGALLIRSQSYGPWGLSTPEIKVSIEEGVEYVYVGGSGGAAFTPNGGFMLNKLTADLKTVWGRNLSNAYGYFNVDYDTLHTKFTLGQGQASLVGYTGINGTNNYDNGMIWTISTHDEFKSHFPGSWVVQQHGDQMWLASDGWVAHDLMADGAKGVEASTLYAQNQDPLAWNNYTFATKVYNLNEKEQGLVGVEKIDFADGGTLDHNPGDIPPSIGFDPINSWSYTLQLSDRGRFIINQIIPNNSYCQNIYITVPLNQDVPFPVGTVITLINTNSNGNRIYVYPADYNSPWSPKIWATGYDYNSQWSFQGMQTATLMKISTNAWLLTANNITNED
jgi:hypothetical protein